MGAAALGPDDLRLTERIRQHADVANPDTVRETRAEGFHDHRVKLRDERLGRRCRREDIVCRYGGEEFAILLPGAGAEEAAEVGERLGPIAEGVAVTPDDHAILLCPPPWIVRRAQEIK